MRQNFINYFISLALSVVSATNMVFFDLPEQTRLVASCGGTVGGTGSNDDYDDDGVCNGIDLDNDNDGILDAVEAPTCFYTASESVVLAKVSTSMVSTVNNVAVVAGADIPTMHDNTSTTNNTNNHVITTRQAFNGLNVYTLEFPTGVNLSSVSVTGNNVTWGNSTTAVLKASNDLSTWTPLMSSAVATTSGATKTFTVNQNSGEYKYYKIEGAAGTSGAFNVFEVTVVGNSTNYIQSAHPKTACNVDTDGDGIIDILDLDSDGDGCPDAVEGGANLKSGDLTTSSAPGGNSGSSYIGSSSSPVTQNLGNTVGNMSTNLGVPTLAGTGQSLHYSQDKSSNECTDTDGDGVDDLADIDDDNDGILDVTECLTGVDHTQETKLLFDFNTPASIDDWAAYGAINAPKHSSTADGDVTVQTVWGGTRIPSPDNSEFITSTDVGGGRGAFQYPNSISSGVYVANLQDVNRLSFDLFNSDWSAGEDIDLNYLIDIYTDGSTISLSGSFTSAQKNTLNGVHNADASIWTTIPGWITMNLDLSSYTFSKLRGIRIYAEDITNGGAEVMALDNVKFYILHSAPTCNTDVDNDGIPNQLDLDSDGDGCPDAVEARVSSNPAASSAMHASGSGLYTGGIPSGTANAYVGDGTSSYGANGFFDGLETSAESGAYNAVYSYQYAANANFNACPDTDTDGVLDAFDIDDDNDGILDAIESPGCYYTADETTAFTVTSDLMHYSTNIITNAYDRNTTTQSAFESGQDWIDKSVFEITPATPVAISAVNFGVGSYYFSQTSSASTFKLQGWNGANWIDLSAPMSNYNSTNDFSINNTLHPTTPYIKYRITGVAGTVYRAGVNEITLTLNQYSASAHPKLSCTDTDTDNDGIPNRLDLDSDGDGCADTNEAILYINRTEPTISGNIKNGSGGTVTSTTTAANAMVPGEYGTNGFADALQSSDNPDNYKSSYTYVGLADNKTNNFCADNDGDGKPDFVNDLDDDNDGIPNAIESPSCYYTEAQATTLTGGVTSDFSWTTAHPLTLTYDKNSDTYGEIQLAVDINKKALIHFDLPLIGFAVIDTVKVLTGSTALGTGTWQLEGLKADGTWEPLSATQTLSAANTTVLFLNTLKPTVQYAEYRIAGASSVLITLAAKIKEFSFHYKNYQASAHPVASGCNSDTDQDGVPNFLDLDSDGDGCPDAVEAGVSGTLQSGTIINSTGSVTAPNAVASEPYGENGLADGVETSPETGLINYASTYDPRAISKFLNACADSDGDGVPDLTDIDDDNDGIVDAAESPACYYLRADARKVVSVSTVLTLGSSTVITSTYDNNTSTRATFSSGQDWVNKTVVEITPTTPLAITSVDIDMQSGAMSANTSSTFKLQGWNGLNWVDLSDPIANNTTNADLSVTNTKQVGAAYTKYRLVGVAGTSGAPSINEITLTDYNYITSAHPRPTCTADFDGDGIVNNLDLDSDNDGCSDLKESGVSPSTDVSTPPSVTNSAGKSYGISAASLTNSQLNPSGTDDNNDGLNDSVDDDKNGQTNYNSTYLLYSLANNLNICADTDGDGVSDITDWDADNDGILDAVESPDCFYTNTEAGKISGVTSPLNAAADAPAAGTEIASLHDGSTSDTNPFNFAGSQSVVPLGTILAIEYPTTVVLTSLTVTQTANGMSTNGYGKIFASADGLVYSEWSPTAVALSAASVTFNSTTTNAYKYYQIRPIGTVAAGNTTSATIGTANIQEITSVMSTTAAYVPSANPKPNCATDTDGDGLFDHLDLDSDGDGCSDAFEGGTNDGSDPVTLGKLKHSTIDGGNSGPTYTGSAGPVNYNLGIDIDEHGVPKIVNGGQITGQSQNKNAQPANCIPVTPPVAVNDKVVNSTPGTAVTLNAISNDIGGDPVKASTFNFIVPSTGGTCMDTDSDGDCDQLTITGEGVWTVTSEGTVTFTPTSGFTKDPTPVDYTIKDEEGETSLQVQIIIDNVPLAKNDSGEGEIGQPATVTVLANDTDGDAAVPATVQIVGTSAPGESLSTSEGTWTVNSTTGAITFTPATGFTLDPAPITYTVKDAQGNVSNTATVSIKYAPLPVTLISLSAVESEEGTKLIWKTSEEKNFDRFEIEQSTQPKNGFNKLGEVKGGGTRYQFIDAVKRSGISYYRLKMIDLDGSYTYSRIVSVQTQNGIELHKVYPNPSQGLKIYLESNEKIESFKIYDVSGREVSAEMNNSNGRVEFQFDKKVPAGVYIITYKVGDRVINEKFVLSY